MKIVIETVKDKKEIRNDDIADYYYDKDGVLNIKVLETGNRYYDYLIIAHELMEVITTEKEDICEQIITQFDDKCSLLGFGEFAEYGNLKQAPYQKQHRFAENIERQLAHELNINWFDYDKHISNL